MNGNSRSNFLKVQYSSRQQESLRMIPQLVLELAEALSPELGISGCTAPVGR